MQPRCETNNDVLQHLHAGLGRTEMAIGEIFIII
jgi:hypothetical protein